MSPAVPTVAELFRRAAACYLRAGDAGAACRCYEDGGAHAEAGRLHERAKRFVPAAEQFERAGSWADAARCRLSANDPRRAAELYLRAGDVLLGAWLLADRCDQGERARAVVAAFDARTDADREAAGLVVGRCDAAAARWADAAGRLQRFAAGLGRLTTSVALRLLSWAEAVGTAAGRPDLIAETFARAVAANVRGAARLWEVWALATFGDATDVPAEPELRRGLHEVRASSAGTYLFPEEVLPFPVGMRVEPDTELGNLRYGPWNPNNALHLVLAGVSGVIADVLVENGQKLQEGDVLFRIDTRPPLADERSGT